MKLEIAINKRQRLLLATILLVIITVIVQIISGIRLDWRGVVVIAVSSYFLTYFALWEEIKGVEFLTLFILPVLFSISAIFSYYLFPVRWLTRLIIDFLFGLLFYSCLLVQNIFNVAAIRTIQLLRVAKTVSLLLTILTYFLIIVVLFSFHLEFYIDMLIIFVLSFLLSIQSIWSVKLKEGIGKWEIIYALGVSILLTELVAILSFWPLSIFIKGIFITGVFYSLIILVNDYFQDSLFSQQIKEFIILVFSLVFLICLMGKWGGG